MNHFFYKGNEECILYQRLQEEAKSLQHMILNEDEIASVFAPMEGNYYYHYVSLLLLRIICGLEINREDKKELLFKEIVLYFSKYEHIDSENATVPFKLDFERSVTERAEGMMLVRNYLNELYQLQKKIELQDGNNEIDIEENTVSLLPVCTSAR